MKTFGSWMYSSAIPDISGQFHVPAASPQGKCPWYALERRLCGPQVRSERCGEENILVPAVAETIFLMKLYLMGSKTNKTYLLLFLTIQI